MFMWCDVMMKLTGSISAGWNEKKMLLNKLIPSFLIIACADDEKSIAHEEAGK